MAVQKHDLLESVICQRLGDVEHMVDEMLEVAVDRAREVHDMACVAIAHGGQDEHFCPVSALRHRERSRWDRRCPHPAADAVRAVRRRRTARRRPCPCRWRHSSRATSISRTEIRLRRGSFLSPPIACLSLPICRSASLSSSLARTMSQAALFCPTEELHPTERPENRGAKP